MFKYVLKRIGYMFLVLFILSIVIFMIYNLTPSNRAYTDAKADQVAMKQQLAGMSAEAQAKWFEERYEMYQISYGTETNNMILRYLRWVGLYPYADNPYTGKEGKLNGLLQGNFGYSYQYKKDVVNVVAAPMKNTIFINIFATILALAITIPLGIACAVRKNSKFDRFTQVFPIIGYSLPSFIICILFIWVFCALLGWFPASGMKTPGSSYEGFKWFTDRMYYLALPLITMTFCSLGSMTRYVRASMIDALSMDCIRTARAKGVKEKTVIYSHAWRNALIPIITVLAPLIVDLMTGSLVVEKIFAIPGVGSLLVTAIQSNDYNVVISLSFIYSAMYIGIMLVVDLLYGIIDPRIRLAKGDD